MVWQPDDDDDGLGAVGAAGYARLVERAARYIVRRPAQWEDWCFGEASRADTVPAYRLRLFIEDSAEAGVWVPPEPNVW